MVEFVEQSQTPSQSRLYLCVSINQLFMRKLYSHLQKQIHRGDWETTRLYRSISKDGSKSSRPQKSFSRNLKFSPKNRKKKQHDWRNSNSQPQASPVPPKSLVSTLLDLEINIWDSKQIQMKNVSIGKLQISSSATTLALIISYYFGFYRFSIRGQSKNLNFKM